MNASSEECLNLELLFLVVTTVRDDEEVVGAVLDQGVQMLVCDSEARVVTAEDFKMTGASDHLELVLSRVEECDVFLDRTFISVLNKFPTAKTENRVIIDRSRERHIIATVAWTCEKLPLARDLLVTRSVKPFNAVQLAHSSLLVRATEDIERAAEDTTAGMKAALDHLRSRSNTACGQVKARCRSMDYESLCNS